jgi:catechol 2,3-dioxygenase-like lactoylglutathione lyase family enzyme
MKATAFVALDRLFCRGDFRGCAITNVILTSGTTQPSDFFETTGEMRRMSTPVTLGPIAHFSFAVSDPRNSARWWTTNFDLEEWSSSDHRVVVGNDSVVFSMVRGRADPTVLTHLAFQVSDVTALASARDRLRDSGVTLEDPGDEIGPVAPGSSSVGLWFHDPDGYRWELYVRRDPDA